MLAMRRNAAFRALNMTLNATIDTKIKLNSKLKILDAYSGPGLRSQGSVSL